MAKVLYVLESGEYSDYQVHAVFARKADAKKAALVRDGIQSYGYGSQVSTLPYYPAGQVPEVVTMYRVEETLWDNGSAGRFSEWENVELEFDHFPTPAPNGRPTVRYVRAPIHQDKGGRLEVWGTDQDKVMKAYRDRRAKWEAQVAGVADA